MIGNLIHSSASDKSGSKKYAPDKFKSTSSRGRERSVGRSFNVKDAKSKSSRKRSWNCFTTSCKCRNLVKSVKKCVTELPILIRILYMGAFFIPHYRPEWGTYIRWNPRVKSRTPEELQKRKARKAIYYQTHPEQEEIAKLKAEENKKTVTDSPPRPMPHDHSDCLLVRINVSGRIFEPQVRSLGMFPNTLLGNPKRMMRFYDPGKNEFFFDRHRTSFEAIISYYQTGGIIRKPPFMGLEHFMEEVKFYDLGNEVIKFLEDSEGFGVDDEKSLPKSLFRRKLWLLFEYPESSYQSRIVAYLSILAVCLSIFEFCIETMPHFHWKSSLFTEDGSPQAVDASNDSDIFDLKDPFIFTETICVIFFVFEYLIRAVMSPQVFLFIKDFSNLIDLVAIIPYFVNLAYEHAEDKTVKEAGVGKSKSASLTIFRIIRLVRVFRILKLSRHNRGLKILGKTLRASIRELGLLVFFLLIGVVVFSSAMFFAEQSNPDTRFDSIPAGFWFSIVTMTTLGYGDLFPITSIGKIVGALCAIAGVLTISLPVPVIVSNFNMFYNREELNEVAQNRTESNHVEQCPFYPGWYSPEGLFLGTEQPKKFYDDDAMISAQFLKGERNIDYSDTDFETLKKDEMFKKVKKDVITRRKKKVRQTRTNPQIAPKLRRKSSLFFP